MENLCKDIAQKSQNERFNNQNIKELLQLITQQNQKLQNLRFLGSGGFSLILKARKNEDQEIAIKIIEYDSSLSAIQAAKREFAFLQGVTKSEYIVKIYDQYDLISLNDQNEKTNTENMLLPRFLVQEMELCSGSLKSLLREFREKKENPSDTLKEILAIQMLDALNFLHSRGIIHRDIKPSNFLVWYNNINSENSPMILKLSDTGLDSLWNVSKSTNRSPSAYQAPETQDQHCFIESDLFSLGMILLELDNPVSFDASKVSSQDLEQLKEGKIFENYDINRNSFLYEIAKTFLKASPQGRESASGMLWKLLIRSKEYKKIPVFSIVFKNQLKPQKPNQSVIQQSSHSSKTHLTTELIESALEQMLEWEDFEGNFDLISQDPDSVVFGARNLKKNRYCVLKLSVCLNKAEEMRKTMIRKICTTPYFVGFYGYHFFYNNDKTHEFVVHELERCRYSLTSYLENQQIEGELLTAQKERIAAQMIDSVNFMHKNQIIHRNITLDSFLVVQEDNELGQISVKLSSFCQATMENYLRFDENSIINNSYVCPSTKQSDWFALGRCLICLDNYLNLPECLLTSKNSLISKLHYSNQCFEPFKSSSPSSFINKNTCIQNLARQFLNYSFNFPYSLDNSIKNLKKICPVYSEDLQYPFQEPLMRHSISLNISTISQNSHQNCLKSLSNFKNLQSLSLNLEMKSIKQKEAQSLLSSLENLSNLSQFSLNLKSNQIGPDGSKHLLSPLANLTSLSCFSLDLSNNKIGNIGAQFLLVPISHLVNLLKLSLNLELNNIKTDGADSLLLPLTNLLNLSALSLNLQWNKIQRDDLQQLMLFPLSNLQNLSILSLNLQHNEINADSAKALLSPIANLSNLTDVSLNLGANEIAQFDISSLFLPSFTNLFNLQTLSLNLETYQITESTAKVILSPLNNLINLSRLSLILNDNQIRGEEAQHLLMPIQNLQNLSSLTLELSNNGIQSDGAKFLLSPIARSINLQMLQLNLKDNDITLEGVKSLLLNLTNLRNIQLLSLNLENNKITDIGEESILSPLSNFINLTEFHLNLEWNKIGEIGAKYLLTPFTNLTNLSRFSLNLGNNEIGVNGAKSLLDPLKNNTNLQTLSLNLNHNKITGIGAKYLLAPLENLLNISNLSLSMKLNQLQLDGTEFLLQSLSNFINLISLSLDLSNNEIKEAQVKQPAKSTLTRLTNFLFPRKSKQITDIPTKSSLLSHLVNLTNLSTLSIFISGNYITDTIANSLLSPLHDFTNLQIISLNINHNEITGIGAKSILSPLSNLHNLTDLSLSLQNNKIKDIGSKYLLSQLTNLASLSTLKLDISQNEISDIGLLSMLSSLTDIINLSSLSLEMNGNPTHKQICAIINILFRKLKKFSIV